MMKLLSFTFAAVLLLAFVMPSKACWTRWFDRETPEGAIDDLRILRAKYPGEICPIPLRVDAITVYGEIPAEETGQTFAAYNTIQGFICLNDQQELGFCYDYKVRFDCPCPL